MKKRIVTLLSIAAAVLAVVALGMMLSARQGSGERPYQPLLSNENTATVAATRTVGSEHATSPVPAAPEVSRRDQAIASQNNASAEAESKPKSKSTEKKPSTESEKSSDDKADPSTGKVNGLTLEQRKACFYDLIGAEDRAVAQAEATYPMDDDPENVQKNVELRLQLQEQFEAEVAQEYGVTAEQLDAIAEEGIRNSWPMPPLPD